MFANFRNYNIHKNNSLYYAWYYWRYDCYVTQVSKLTFSLSHAPEHDGHGLIVKIEGKKPASLVQPVHIALDVSGQQFWRVAAQAFGEWASSLGR